MKFFVLSILIVVTLGCFGETAAQEVVTKATREATVKEAKEVKEAQEIPINEDIDLSDVTIEMKRDGSSLGCINCADIYKVSITGSGILHFEGKVGAKLNGKYTFTVDPEIVKALVAEFQKIDFFALGDSYTSKQTKDGLTMTVSHGMKTTTAITLNGKTKSVFNFYGAPAELDLLQNKIDTVVQNIIR